MVHMGNVRMRGLWFRIELLFVAANLWASDVCYDYNVRSELTSVTRNGEVLYGYEYDLAGNLKWSCTGCNTNVYETNCLNQYTTVADSGGIHLR